MEDLTSNWLWYGELRPLSGPGARRQWSPERTEAQRKQALTRWQCRQQCSDDSRDGAEAAVRSCTVSAETGSTLFSCFTPKSDFVGCKNQLHQAAGRCLFPALVAPTLPT